MTSWLVSLLSSSDFWTAVAVGIAQPFARVFAEHLIKSKKKPPGSKGSGG